MPEDGGGPGLQGAQTRRREEGPVTVLEEVSGIGTTRTPAHPFRGRCGRLPPNTAGALGPRSTEAKPGARRSRPCGELCRFRGPGGRGEPTN